MPDVEAGVAGEVEQAMQVAQAVDVMLDLLMRQNDRPGLAAAAQQSLLGENFERFAHGMPPDAEAVLQFLLAWVPGSKRIDLGRDLSRKLGNECQMARGVGGSVRQACYKPLPPGQ